MLDKSTIQNLKKFAFFKNVSESEITKLSISLSEKEFNDKDLLIEQNTHADTLLFITEGHVKVYVINEEGKEINLAILGAYETIGEIAVFIRGDRTAYCEAVGKVKTFVLQGDVFRNFLLENPETALAYLKYFAERLMTANKHMQEITSLGLKDRTYLFLSNLVQMDNNKTIELTQETIATILSATRPRVTEALKMLEKEHKISVLRGKIKVL